MYLRFEVGGVDLNKALCLQNEKGLFLMNGSTRIGVPLAKFEEYYIKHKSQRRSGGSHSTYKYPEYRYKLDFRCNALLPVTANQDVKMTKTTNYGGSFCEVECGARVLGKARYGIRLMHTMKFKKTGTIVKKGQVICYIATRDHLKKYNAGDIYPHLDIAGRYFGIEGRYARRWILG